MTLLRDVAPAAWIDAADLSWSKLIFLGPDGFERYTRLRLIPDPTGPLNHPRTSQGILCASTRVTLSLSCVPRGAFRCSATSESI